MIRVTVEVIYAGTGKVEKLGVINVANIGPTSDVEARENGGERFYSVGIDAGRAEAAAIVRHRRADGWRRLVRDAVVAVLS